MAKPQPLDERVKLLRAEIDSYIDGLVERDRKLYPGVPPASLRISLTRGLGCQCAAYLLVKAQQGEAA